MTYAAVTVTSCEVLLPASTTVKRVRVPGVAEKSAALMALVPSFVPSFTRSMSLTLSTRAPRRRSTPGRVAGEPAST
ncbi:hypothetical protein D3C87_1747240 [compost metagenome]